MKTCHSLFKLPYISGTFADHVCPTAPSSFPCACTLWGSHVLFLGVHLWRRLSDEWVLLGKEFVQAQFIISRRVAQDKHGFTEFVGYTSGSIYHLTHAEQVPLVWFDSWYTAPQALGYWFMSYTRNKKPAVPLRGSHKYRLSVWGILFSLVPLWCCKTLYVKVLVNNCNNCYSCKKCCFAITAMHFQKQSHWLEGGLWFKSFDECVFMREGEMSWVVWLVFSVSNPCHTGQHVGFDIRGVFTGVQWSEGPLIPLW